MDPVVLCVDDDRPNLELFRRWFAEELPVLTSASGDEALGVLERRPVAVLVTDQRMPRMTGIELLSRVAERWPETTRMLLTAYSDRDLLLEAIQKGQVHDYVLKPWNGQDLELRLRKGVDAYAGRRSLARAAAECESLRQELHEHSGSDEVVGFGAGLRAIALVVDKIARSDATVLIRGETGAGKEIVARQIHARSNRAASLFVRTNCAALSETLLESELFGHEAGAFTGATKRRIGRFEQANGGTIFLDEIGDISPATQVRLLRVLEGREIERVGGERPVPIDIRVIAATHRNLEQMISNGSFREDLYHRLNVIPITVPPLRARTADIEPLAEHFLHHYAMTMGKALALSPSALERLRRYDWPGNVRELRNVVERAVVLAEPTATLHEDDFLLDVGVAPGPPTSPSLFDQIAHDEAERVREALRAAGGSKARAARLLGIPRTTLSDRIRRFGIE